MDKQNFNTIDFPFKKKKTKIPLIKKNIVNNNKKQNTKENKLKDPIAIIIKENKEAEIIEDVRSGKLKIKREAGKGKDREVEIILPKTKMISLPFGNEIVKAFIIDETEAVAIPTDTIHDSLELKRIILRKEQNYKELEAQGKIIKSWGMVIIYIAIALGIILFMINMVGFDQVETFLWGTKATAQAATTITNIPPEPFIN